MLQLHPFSRVTRQLLQRILSVSVHILLQTDMKGHRVSGHSGLWSQLSVLALQRTHIQLEKHSFSIIHIS